MNVLDRKLSTTIERATIQMENLDYRLDQRKKTNTPIENAEIHYQIVYLIDLAIKVGKKFRQL